MFISVHDYSFRFVSQNTVSHFDLVQAWSDLFGFTDRFNCPHVELNPGPLQKKPIYLLTCLPAISVISGLVSHTNDELLSTNYADTRHVRFCGSYYLDLFHQFSYRPCLLPLSSAYRRCRAGRRVRERRARNTLITSVCLIPVANNRNDHFKYFLGVGVRLIEVCNYKCPFKVTRPSFFWGVPSYFEALWYPHLYFYRKSNT